VLFLPDSRALAPGCSQCSGCQVSAEIRCTGASEKKVRAEVYSAIRVSSASDVNGVANLKSQRTTKTIRKSRAAQRTRNSKHTAASTRDKAHRILSISRQRAQRLKRIYFINLKSVSSLQYFVAHTEHREVMTKKH